MYGSNEEKSQVSIKTGTCQSPDLESYVLGLCGHVHILVLHHRGLYLVERVLEILDLQILFGMFLLHVSEPLL